MCDESYPCSKKVEERIVAARIGAETTTPESAPSEHYCQSLPFINTTTQNYTRENSTNRKNQTKRVDATSVTTPLLVAKRQPEGCKELGKYYAHHATNNVLYLVYRQFALHFLHWDCRRTNTEMYAMSKYGRMRSRSAR